MTITNRTFSVKNGIDVANTIIIDSSRNLSNVAAANVTSLNTSANIANAGNLLVTQNTFTGNLSVTSLANITSLNAVTSNHQTLNVTQNTITGNLTVTQNISVGNLSITTLMNVVTLNVSQNIANAGNIQVTQNIATGNLSVTTLANIASLNAVTSNHATLNVSGTSNQATVNIKTALSSVGTTFVRGTYGGVALSAEPGGAVQMGTVVGTNLVVVGVHVSNAIGADASVWETLYTNANTMQMRVLSDAYDNANIWLLVTRDGTDNSISTIRYGQPDGTTGHTFLGNISAGNTGTVNLSVTTLANISTLNVSGISNVNQMNVNSTLVAMGTSIFRGVYPGAAARTADPGGIFVGSQGSGNQWYIGMGSTNSATDCMIWEQDVSNVNTYIFRVVNDAYTSANNYLTFTRANDTVITMLYGQPGTVTAHTFRGSINVNATINTTVNIANAGNVLVTQNTFTGNLGVTQNISVGNISTTQNISAGNASITTTVNTATLNASAALISMGDLIVRGALPGTGVINAGGIVVGTQGAGNIQCIEIFTNNAAVDNGWWEIIAQNNGTLAFRTANDTYGNTINWLKVTRANANSNIGSIVLGDTADMPTINVLGFFNVSANISNTGNLLVTQNTFTGNLTVTQNISAGNLSVTTLMNTTTLNASQNIANAGNVLVSQNVITGNITINQNTSTGNLSVTQNASAGNLSITQNGTFGNANSTNANISGQIYIGTNILIQSVSTGNGVGPTITSANQTILYSKNVANIAMLFVGSGRANASLYDTTAPDGPSEGFKVISTVTPNAFGTTNTTCFISYGAFAGSMNIVANVSYCNTSNGIPTNVTPSMLNSHKAFMLGANNSATLGNASIFANANTFWDGGIAAQTGNGGGYIFTCKFGLNVFPPNTRVFVGVTNATASMVSGAADVDPLSNTSNSWTIFGVGANGNNAAVVGNLSIVWGQATGVRSILDLGNQYTLAGNTGVYELVINVPPGNTTIGWTIRNLANGASNTGVVTTKLPDANTFMQPVAFLKSNTTTASNMSVMKMYAETDY